MAGGIDIALALILAPRYADFGMAWVAVLTEGLIAAGLYLVLRFYRLDPLRAAVGCEGGAA